MAENDRVSSCRGDTPSGFSRPGSSLRVMHIADPRNENSVELKNRLPLDFRRLSPTSALWGGILQDRKRLQNVILLGKKRELQNEIISK